MGVSYAKKSFQLGMTGRGKETLHEHTLCCNVRRAGLDVEEAYDLAFRLDHGARWIVMYL
jgi:hypothetical protein